MSMTAYQNDPACKPLEDAGFTDVQIAALSEFTRQSITGRIPIRVATHVRAQRIADPARGGSIAHAIAMLVLALGGLGALLTILIRVA